MTIQLFDPFDHQLTVGGISPDVGLALIGQLPPEVQIRIRPDHQVLEDPCPACGAQPAGYWGLAVALARETWRA